MTKPATTYDLFSRKFGQDQADAVLAAARHHKNGVHDNEGNDPMAWAVLLAIGYQCVSEPSYAAFHKITIDPAAYKTWCRRNKKRLGRSNGDLDYLALFTGVYSTYLGITDDDLINNNPLGE